MFDEALSDEDQALLERLLRARGPSGDEREVREVCREALAPLCDELWEDPAGNLVGLVRAETAEAPPVTVVSHMDEIAMIVKRVEADGRLTVTNLGGDRPMSFGQCAVDILADSGPLTGVFSLGSLHRTSESADMAQLRQHGPNWEEVFVITGRSREALIEAGAHPGTRVVLSQAERCIVSVGALYGAHFMDDRAPLLGGILALRRLREQGARLRRDVYHVCSTREETTNAGASYAARTLPGEQMIALEVGPVAAEYQTTLSSAPILSYGDQKGLYTPALVDALRAAAEAEGIEPQLALLEDFASDASAAIRAGLKAQTAVMCVPTQNTHGFEVVHKGAIPAFAAVLARFLAA